ncbi:hypothetical protein J1N35_018039 [Gossypium stocksii]|uniref:Uncharacterized protein n=1 Tax=Gossypium stocksii TaxID=47602 RepID=A0A9D3VPB9_9ROSI|nr:hypothetical protein J1N35_018039 [Gossypium stocksii]
MAVESVTMRMQKELGMMQGELTQLEGYFRLPLGFLAKEHLVVSPILDLGHSSMSSRGGTLEVNNTAFQFHDEFLSLLNQLNLSETYALRIFVNNLKPEISQYLRLFKPQTLVEGYNLARQAENIVFELVKKGFIAGNGHSSSRPLFSNSRVQQGMESSNSIGGK